METINRTTAKGNEMATKPKTHPGFNLPGTPIRTDSYSVSFWVSRYEDNRGMKQSWFDNRDDALAAFNRIKGDREWYYFVQMGARTEEGSIVLNEWRRPEAKGGAA